MAREAPNRPLLEGDGHDHLLRARQSKPLSNTILKWGTIFSYSPLLSLPSTASARGMPPSSDAEFAASPPRCGASAVLPRDPTQWLPQQFRFAHLGLRGGWRAILGEARRRRRTGEGACEQKQDSRTAAAFRTDCARHSSFRHQLPSR
jgi:hypothetical protein